MEFAAMESAWRMHEEERIARERGLAEREGLVAHVTRFVEHHYAAGTEANARWRRQRERTGEPPVEACAEAFAAWRAKVVRAGVQKFMQKNPRFQRQLKEAPAIEAARRFVEDARLCFNNAIQRDTGIRVPPLPTIDQPTIQQVDPPAGADASQSNARWWCWGPETLRGSWCALPTLAHDFGEEEEEASNIEKELANAETSDDREQPAHRGRRKRRIRGHESVIDDEMQAGLDEFVGGDMQAQQVVAIEPAPAPAVVEAETDAFEELLASGTADCQPQEVGTCAQVQRTIAARACAWPDELAGLGPSGCDLTDMCEACVYRMRHPQSCVGIFRPCKKRKADAELDALFGFC
jgi:hypothetical protein